MKAPLYIYVDPHLFEFFATLTNSPEGIIMINPRDKFFEDLKFILQLNPTHFPLKIEAPKKRLTLLLPSYSILNKRINTRYRNHLDPQREQMVIRQLNRTYKHIFHSFVLGACMTGRKTGVKQVDAIRNFFMAYNMQENNSAFDTLLKSWNRSEEKKKLIKFIKISP